MKVNEIKEKLNSGSFTREEWQEWSEDTRASVRRLLEAHLRKEEADKKEEARFAAMLAYEKKYWDKDMQYVAGVDEAGRGPLAGPLAVAAVILPHDIFIPGLNDSKKLTAKKREELYDEICAKAVAVVVNIVGPGEIDRKNIYRATKESMARVLETLEPRPAVALTDAMPEELEGMVVEDIIKGDAKSASIAAASIIAKVTRDRLMLELDKEFPAYGFAENKGYGSQKHMEAVALCGASPWHRRSFEPVKSMHVDSAAVEENLLLTLRRQEVE